MLTAFAQKVIKARNKEQLFDDACNVAVEHGNFLMAWVGLEDKVSHTIIPAARCGHEEGYLDVINVASDNTPEGTGPTGAAFRSGKHAVCNDIENDHMMAPWKDAALSRGYRSSAAFPLYSGMQVLGTFNVYSAVTGFFNDKEILLLDELAANISHALEFIEQEELRRQAEEALRDSEESYSSLFHNMLEGYAYCKMVFEQDKAVDFIYLNVNNAFERLTGLKDVVGRKISDVIPDIRKSHPELFEIFGRVVLTGRPEEFETYSESFGGWLAVSVYSADKNCFVAVFDNITERKLSEDALVKNNRELSALNRVADIIATSPDIESMAYNVLDATLALPFLEVQKKAALFLRDEADPDKLNMTAHIGIAPELVEMEKQIRMGYCLCGKAAETGEVVTSEDCFADPGHKTHYDAMKRHGHAVIPIKSKVGVLGVMTFYLEPGTLATEPDIRLLISIARQLAVAIENRQLFHNIEKANKEWRETFDAIDELVTIHSKDFTILRANKAAAKAAGMSVKDMVGRKCYELFHGSSEPTAACPAKKMMDGQGSAVSYEVNIGAYAHEITVYPLIDESGFTGYVHIAKDITERKAAEAALKESESKFRILVEQSLVGVYIIQDGLFKYVNPRFAEIFGYTPEEITLVKSPRDLTLQEDWPIVEESIRRRESGEVEKLHYTFRGVTKQGGTIHLEIHGSNTMYEGKLAGIGVLTDITERLTAQEELVKRSQQMATLRQAMAQADEVSRLKSEFLANMSHELRTPLNAVIGLSQVLQDGTYGQMTPKQAEYLDGINQSGKHLLSLINDILDLSKIEAGKEQLELAEFSMANLLKNSFMLVKEKALKHGIELVLDIGPEIGNFYADERRVKQILFNLLSNSVKFTGPGGKVGLRAYQDRLAMAITVWDTGIGIPKDKQHLLFQPFQMVDNSLSKKHEGTGLGLVLIKRLVEMHGGTVSFESNEGEGTSFTVLLPDRTPEMTGRHETPADTISTAIQDAEEISTDGRKVMMVEDNRLNMMLASDYLKANGLTVIDAANGEIALEKVLRERPDIILLDIQMPGIDGFEVIRRLKEYPVTSGIPVIAMTALAMKGDEERCVHAGFDDYISKPVDLEDMLKKVRRYLGKGINDG